MAANKVAVSPIDPRMQTCNHYFPTCKTHCLAKLMTVKEVIMEEPTNNSYKPRSEIWTGSSKFSRTNCDQTSKVRYFGWRMKELIVRWIARWTSRISSYLFLRINSRKKHCHISTNQCRTRTSLTRVTPSKRSHLYRSCRSQLSPGDPPEEMQRQETPIQRAIKEKNNRQQPQRLSVEAVAKSDKWAWAMPWSWRATISSRASARRIA